MHEKITVQFYDYIHGGLDPGERKLVDDHLRSCVSCQREFESVKEITGQLRFDTIPSDERGEQFWVDFSANVEKKLAGRRKKESIGFIDSLYSLLMLNKKVTISFSTAMIALFLAGIWFSVREEPAVVSGGDRIAAAEDSIPVEARIGNYFRKSKTLLVGLSNIEPLPGESRNLELEHDISRELMDESKKIRMQAVDIRSVELMREMDKLLVEFSEIPSQPSNSEIENIRRQIYNQNLLFRVRMAESSFRTVSRRDPAGSQGRPLR